MEIDHIFLRARRGAPEAAALIALGLSEGSANRHPGQGTANRRFFFHNAFLELLWIEDAAQVSNTATSPTQLTERLDSEGNSSPFGLCFRPAHQQQTPPFPSWPYRPAYLPAGMQIDIASGAPLHEPMWFFLAQALAPAQAAPARRQPLQHALGLCNISAVTLTVATDADWSPAAQAASSGGAITLQRGTSHLLELSFDGAKHGRHIDLRPTLPLVLHL
ncbi:VOC family protein [Duganella qianjiadongensis]|uniref:Glyoxalase-like domain protein n=1 Tax=Duganella qianjiadongensis TaxID=2692176 RepID=A0ABW9VNA3_9BURK|nr:VOC family protein [Duganella qianjiadongensis]MYM41076.1 glyoxalase-like domain protein [Duganella qianjiadongensis]